MSTTDEADSPAPRRGEQFARGAGRRRNAVGGFGYACPQCGHRLPDYRETCPECGAELDALFSATYRVPMSSAGRKIALIVLIGLALLLLLVVVALLSQLLAPPAPAHGT